MSLPHKWLTFERLEDRVLLAPLAVAGSQADGGGGLEPDLVAAELMSSPATPTVAYSGTTGDDVFQLDLTNRRLVVNAQMISLDPAVTRVVLDGLGGNDSFDLTGSAGHETVGLLPGQTLLLASTAGLKANAKSVESVRYDGNGGNDVAQLFVSTGADQFAGQAGLSRLVGPGYDNRVLDVDTVFAVGNEGSSDSARLFDSAGDDVFVSSVSQAIMRSTGSKVFARRFNDVVGYATSGGNDSAALYGTDVVDVLEAGPTLTSLFRVGGVIGRASGFESVTVYGLGERDQGQLTGSAGVDTLIARQDRFVFSGPGFRIIGLLIDSFVATAVGSGDLAVLTDSPGNDAFQGAGNRGDFDGDLADYTVIDFSQVTIQGTTGFNASVLNAPITYTLIEQGPWI